MYAKVSFLVQYWHLGNRDSREPGSIPHQQDLTIYAKKRVRMGVILLIQLWLLLLPLVTAEYQLYRFYDRATIVEAWNITDACINAL